MKKAALGICMILPLLACGSCLGTVGVGNAECERCPAAYFRFKAQSPYGENTVPALIEALAVSLKEESSSSCREELYAVRRYALERIEKIAGSSFGYGITVSLESNSFALGRMHDWWHKTRYYTYRDGGNYYIDATAMSERRPTAWEDVDRFKAQRFLYGVLAARAGETVSFPLCHQCYYQPGSRTANQLWLLSVMVPKDLKLEDWWKSVRASIVWNAERQDFEFQ